MAPSLFFVLLSPPPIRAYFRAHCALSPLPRPLTLRELVPGRKVVPRVGDGRGLDGDGFVRHFCFCPLVDRFSVLSEGKRDNVGFQSGKFGQCGLRERQLHGAKVAVGSEKQRRRARLCFSTVCKRKEKRGSKKRRKKSCGDFCVFTFFASNEGERESRKLRKKWQPSRTRSASSRTSCSSRRAPTSPGALRRSRTRRGGPSWPRRRGKGARAEKKKTESMPMSSPPLCPLRSRPRSERPPPLLPLLPPPSTPSSSRPSRGRCPSATTKRTGSVGHSKECYFPRSQQEWSGRRRGRAPSLPSPPRPPRPRALAPRGKNTLLPLRRRRRRQSTTSSTPWPRISPGGRLMEKPSSPPPPHQRQLRRCTRSARDGRGEKGGEPPPPFLLLLLRRRRLRPRRRRCHGA